MAHKCNINVDKNVKYKEKVRIHTNFFIYMLHSLIIQIKVSSIKKADIRKCLIKTHLIYLFVD